MGQTVNLYRLQQIDSQLERSHSRLAAVIQLLEDDNELRSARQQAQEAEAACEVAERSLRKAEADVEAQRIKIEQAEASLYGGSVRNPKELQELQNDVAALKRHLATLEDRQLEAMAAGEAAETASRTSSAQALSLHDRRTKEGEALKQEQDGLLKEIERLKTERAAVLGSIAQPALSTYESLRQQRRGVAVAAISDDSCGACGSSLTPAQVQAARSGGALALCPSCGRVLYGS